MTTGPTPSIHESPTLDLRANPDRGRYELWDDQQFIGFLGVEIIDDGTVDVQHAIVAEAFGRQGYARTLVTFVFDKFREQGVQIRPTCTYVLDYLQRFPSYQDLVAETPDPRNQE